MKPQKVPRCPDCGRHPSECWVMPCLGLELAMRRGLAGMRAWSRACGIVIRNVEALKDEIAKRKERVGP